MHSYAYAYLVGSLLSMPVWIILFIIREDLRREMIKMSLIGAFLAVFLAPPFLADYWHPEYINGFRFGPFGGVEDIFYGFFFVGIGSVIYEVILRKKLSRRRHTGLTHYWWLALGFYIAAFYVPVALGYSSINAAVASFTVLICLMLSLRKDLIIDSLVSGVILLVLVFFGYLFFLSLYPALITNFWNTSNLIGIYLFHIPIEELIWAFGIGAAAGPAYEFVIGSKLR